MEKWKHIKNTHTHIHGERERGIHETSHISHVYFVNIFYFFNF